MGLYVPVCVQKAKWMQFFFFLFYKKSSSTMTWMCAIVSLEMNCLLCYYFFLILHLDSPSVLVSMCVILSVEDTISPMHLNITSEKQLPLTLLPVLGSRMSISSFFCIEIIVFKIYYQLNF